MMIEEEDDDRRSDSLVTSVCYISRMTQRSLAHLTKPTVVLIRRRGYLADQES